MTEYKFRAYDHKREIYINDGDYWFPASYGNIKPSASNCYPVKVTNHGILFSRKLKNNKDDMVIVNGQSFYSDWEYESLSGNDLTIELLENTK